MPFVVPFAPQAALRSRCAMPSAALVLAGGALLAACSSDDTAVPPPVDASAGGQRDATSDATFAPDDGRSAEGDAGGASIDARAPVASADATASRAASIRVANWVRDAPPFDFCLAARGLSRFRGPLLRGLLLADSGDAGGAAIAYPMASAYAPVDADTYDLRLVVAGASDCSTGIVDLTSLPSLPVGGYLTLAVIGTLSADDASPLRVVGLFDDGAQKPAAGGASKLALRAFNADDQARSVDVATANGSVTFSQLAFGAVSATANLVLGDGGAPGSIDPWGYATVDPLAGATLLVRAHGAAASLATAAGVTLAGGASITLVVLPVARGAVDAGAGLLRCVDNAGVVGAFSSCALISK